MAMKLDGPEAETRSLVDALLSASRALVAVAARSLGAYEGEVTLAQYRVLVVLCSLGPQRVVDLAEALAVTQPNATRICGRLSHKGLVRRSRSSADRRTVRVSVTPEGHQVVDQVSAARRQELGRIVGNMTSEHRDQLIEALAKFTAAAGGTPEDGWVLGWGQ
ncbi:MAG TPA: MarR family transcriptional regulator [Acidimicrobiales bacterium]|nr:MarR family transcriptional regulator [Acidimicrobiales bacterium]